MTSIISPGKRVEVRLIDDEGDDVGRIYVNWQERDADRELQIDVSLQREAADAVVVTYL